MTAPAQNITAPAPEALAGFADPAAVGGTRPAIRDLVGRTVVIRPLRYEPSAPGIKPGTTQERITADILIVTGGPLEFGGSPQGNKPHTFRVAAPYLATGVYISNTNIVASVRDQTGRGVVLGQIAVGITNTQGNNPPYNLLKVEPTAPEYQMAAALYTQVINKQFVNPTPVSIGAAPAQVTVNGQAATYVPAGATMTTPTPPTAAPVQDPAAAFQEWLRTQAQGAAPAESIPPTPSGWADDVWRGLTADMRTQVLAAKPF